VVSDTNVSDSGLSPLKGLPSLHAVVHRGTKVTASGVNDLQKALPKANISD